MSTTLRIKNMVCRHCVAALTGLLDSLGIAHGEVRIGSADIDADLDASQLANLDRALAELGFERITDADEALVEATKHAIMEHVRDADHCRLKISACIADHVGASYDTLSRMFSRHEGRTIEQYTMAQRVEYVKELLGYGERTLTEIADIAGYSSAAHLSRQFKAVTGMTPTAWLALNPPRTSLDKV